MYFVRAVIGLFGLIIFIVILVALFTHGKKPAPGPALQPLPDYAGTTAEVSFTTDGIVNGDEMHRAIKITISNDTREVQVLQGYNPQVIMDKTFQNNQEAYTVFLKAINNAGFLKKTKSKVTDERGICPLGYRYILDLSQDGSDLSRTWTSTCGGSTPTSGAALSTVQTLFQDQIPDYGSLVGNVNLSATSDSDNNQ